MASSGRRDRPFQAHSGKIHTFAFTNLSCPPKNSFRRCDYRRTSRNHPRPWGNPLEHCRTSGAARKPSGRARKHYTCKHHWIRGARLAPNGKKQPSTSLPWAYLRLPPFPQVAIRVLQLANNENVQMSQISSLISTDPAFASEVLTVANSAFYSPRYPSTTVAQAVAMLGANRLQGMCVTVGVRAYLGKSMNFPALRNLWRHNLACAIIAQRLAAGSDIDPDIAYTSGILHDIGRMALAVIQPKAYAELLETHRGPSASVLEAERELFGWNHCEIGRQLIADWKLPSGFEAVVADHLAPLRTDGAWDVSELVKVSCAMASAVGFAAFPWCEPTPFPHLLASLPQCERKTFQSDPETLNREIAESIHAVELL
jgi:HD-like signal output (HDOD) protein